MIGAVDHRRYPLDTERVTVGDAARILGVHPDTLKANRGRAYPSPARIGPRGDRRYAVSELREYLERDR